MKFILEIELGNDAMQKVAHIEDALQTLAESGQLRKYMNGAGEFELPDGGKIYDANGAAVGKWEVTA